MSEFRLHDQLDHIITLLMIIAGILVLMLIRGC